MLLGVAAWHSQFCCIVFLAPPPQVGELFDFQSCTSSLCELNEVQQGQVQGVALGLGQSQRTDWEKNLLNGPAEKDLGVLQNKKLWRTKNEPAVCACSLEGQWYPGLHQKRGGSREREAIAPSLLLCCGPSWSTASRPGAPWGSAQEGCGAVGVGLVEHHKDVLQPFNPFLWRKVEWVRLVHLGEEKAPRSLSVAYQYLRVVYKQETDFLHGLIVTGQGRVALN